jgi:beta-glucosidase
LAVCLVATAFVARAQEVPVRGSTRVESLLARMNVEEKIGQLVQMPGGRQKALNSRINDEERARIRAGRVGSYLNVAGAEATRELQRIAIEESRLGIPLMFGMDVIHGYRTIFPVPLAMAASWDPMVIERAARVAAVETAASGVHWTFSPMVDIARDPRWGRIVEGAGEDPYLGAVMAAAQVRGYQSGDLARPDTIMATAKHFAAYGAAAGGRDYDGADISERSLNEIYLPPFYAAAREGAGSFMASFNEIGGVPAHANRALLRDILRERWRWPGVMISDWNAVAELRAHGVAESDTDAAALALAAGVDIDMSSGLYMATLAERVAREPALLRRLDEAVRRVLAAKERLGLFDDPYRRSDAAREAASILTPAHRAIAREAAVRSIVLLKNEGDLLPIATGVRRIALAGDLALDANSQLGSWRAQGRAEDVRALLPALRAALPGAEIFPTNDAAAAAGADLILLVVGENFDLTGEARSRADLTLQAGQQALADAMLDTGRPVIVILTGGRPLAIERLATRAPAILETWLLGVEAGPAIADIITGRAAPGGRLPVGFPRASGAVPSTYAHLPTGRPADPDPARDTARYRDLPITPLFPFGHGLSYASFVYSDLRVAEGGAQIRVGVTVRNSGQRAGEEVVQLYARDPVASVSRPVQELRGFRRIALAPGEAKRVTFTLTPAQFAIWGAGRWRIEPGEIQLMLGSSSADIRARASFRIAAAAEGAEPAAAILTPSSEEIVR